MRLDLPRPPYQQAAIKVPPKMGRGLPCFATSTLDRPYLPRGRTQAFPVGLELEGPPRAQIFTTSPTDRPPM